MNITKPLAPPELEAAANELNALRWSLRKIDDPPIVAQSLEEYLKSGRRKLLEAISIIETYLRSTLTMPRLMPEVERCAYLSAAFDLNIIPERTVFEPGNSREADDL